MAASMPFQGISWNEREHVYGLLRIGSSHNGALAVAERVTHPLLPMEHSTPDAPAGREPGTTPLWPAQVYDLLCNRFVCYAVGAI